VAKDLTYYINTVGMRLARVPPGSFRMGEEGEGGRHTVAAAFCMGACEVTNAQYQRFVRESGYDGRPDTVHEYMHHFRDRSGYAAKASTDPDYPMVFVSWRNARKFCEWLSRKEGVRYRLPTELEWEYACRAGSTTPYYWGDRVRGDCVWYGGNSGKRTRRVGGKLPNAFGLHDMSGNAEEWCQSLHRSYPYRGDDGREDLRDEGDRVLRGGSVFSTVSMIRSTDRDGDNSAHPYVTYGFRVLVPLGPAD
jgi:formylglycine-generating enzyme required for sulfatase activity